MTAWPAMTACVGFVETTFVVGGGSSPATMPRSTVTFCSTSVAFKDTLDATGGMPQSPPTVKRVGVFTWTGLMVVRVSSTRQGGTVKKLSARSGLVESPATTTRASQPQRYLGVALAMGVSFVLRATRPPGREGRARTRPPPGRRGLDRDSLCDRSNSIRSLPDRAWPFFIPRRDTSAGSCEDMPYYCSLAPKGPGWRPVAATKPARGASPSHPSSWLARQLTTRPQAPGLGVEALIDGNQERQPTRP